MDIKIYRLLAFTKHSVGGNPAGVVLNADGIDERSMIEIASEIGYSETAFVSKSNRADYKVRFFTPTEEVDICGHATIATFSLLRDLDSLPCGKYTQETKAGILEVIVNENDVSMEQNKPVFADIIRLEDICECFGSSKLVSIDNRPIQIVSTGLSDILLPVKNLEDINELKPNFERIKMISKKYDVVGIHAFTEETGNVSDAVCRNFAPRYGIDEEAATGTSNGALACYLYTYRKYSNKNYIFTQGYSLNNPSEIKVELETDNNIITGLFVGGCANRIE